MIDQKPPASIALDSLGISHRLFRHEKPVSSFEEAASARNQRPEQIVRSILFQVKPGDFVLVLMAGPDQIDWKKLRRIVKRSRVRMATEEEVLDVTGYRVGTVSPFGLKRRCKANTLQVSGSFGSSTGFESVTIDITFFRIRFSGCWELMACTA